MVAPRGHDLDDSQIILGDLHVDDDHIAVFLEPPDEDIVYASVDQECVGVTHGGNFAQAVRPHTRIAMHKSLKIRSRPCRRVDRRGLTFGFGVFPYRCPRQSHCD